MLLMTVISFIVGLSISGQTFYTFILENLEKFGALKAIGAKGRELVVMILFQAAFVALTGYGIGVGLCALMIWLARLYLPDYAAIITFSNLGAGLRHGGRHRRDLQLRRRPQGAEDRALRHLPGLDHGDKSQSRPIGLNKWFGEGEARTHAVKDVSFEAYFGEMLYVVGPSGSGKTTMLSMISGILRPNAGTVKIEGTDIWSLGNDAARRIPAAQDRLRVPGLSPVSAPDDRRERGHPADSAEARLGRGAQRGGDTIWRSSGLKDRAQLPPVKLSGGEQQRVAIARAIVSRPDILILDEPTASLDGDTGRNIVKFVREHILTDQRCIVIVTHDSRIYEFADRIMKMEDGKLIGDRSKENLNAQ